jgi:hypothetical protein
MRQLKANRGSEVSLPWSDGLLSARISHRGGRTIAGVPELGLHCYGNSQTEAVFRLFTTLLKYYRQLKTFRGRLGVKGELHLQLLSSWVEAIENKMKLKVEEKKVVALSKSRSR